MGTGTFSDDFKRDAVAQEGANGQGAVERNPTAPPLAWLAKNTRLRVHTTCVF